MKKLLLLSGLAAGFFSCVKVDSGLGGDFIATNQKYDIHTAEFNLDEIWMKPADSLSAYSSRRITIGSIRDGEYGLFRRGCAITLVPVLDSVYFGEDPRFKSFTFRAALDSTSVSETSQSNILQNINVYALEEPVNRKNYFSRVELKHSAGRITKGVPVTNGSDSLTFAFTEDFGRKYLGIKQKDLADIDTYQTRFPGIYLCTDDPVGEGGRINMYQMDILRVSQSAIVRTDNYAVLRYSGVYNGTRRDSLLMFYFSPQKFQNLDSLIRKKTLPSQYVFNVDYHESDHLAGRADDKIYVEGGSGLKPVVLASEIKRLVSNAIASKGGDPSTALISKATIELPFVFPDDYTTLFRFPMILSPTIRIRTDTTATFAGLTDASVSTENQGKINRSRCNYAPDITHHVQQIIRTKENGKLANYDVWFLIMRNEQTTTTNAEADQLSQLYQQMAYYEYANRLYGGGYYGGAGYYGGGYNSYYGGGYSNYFNYMLMAQQARRSATTTGSAAELDKDRYYRAVLNGPGTDRAEKPKLKVSFAIPRK